MTEKPNYFKLGVFLLIAVALIVGGLILFGSGTFAKKKMYFETYFAGSVHGLTRGSSVLLSGVEIGVVENVTFVRKSYDLPLDEDGISKYDQHVLVQCSAIEEKLPISEIEGRQKRLTNFIEKGFRLRLGSNLITGQAYLEAAILDPERFPAMEISWKPQYDYVPSAPSTFKTMEDSVVEILKKLEEIEFNTVVDNLNKVLESANQSILDANIKALSAKIEELLGDADQAIIDAEIKDLSTQASAFIDELRVSNADLKKLLENSDSTKELANIAVLVDNFNQVLDNLDNLIKSEKPELREIIKNIRNLSENLEYLSEHLKDNPSELIFSSPPPKQEK